MRPDGVILYHGRADDQLKGSGVRMERGEIANAVLDHPAIRSAHVMMFDPAARPEKFCKSCGISDWVPDVGFEQDAQCAFCRDFEQYPAHAKDYFGVPEDLSAIMAEAATPKSGK